MVHMKNSFSEKEPIHVTKGECHYTIRKVARFSNVKGHKMHHRVALA